MASLREGETPSTIQAVRPWKALCGGRPGGSAELSIMTMNFMDFGSDFSEIPPTKPGII